jgi:Protein of unknown function (DUF1176)
MNLLKTLSLTIALTLYSGLSMAGNETTRQFKDWRASCDNNGNCQGVANDTRRNNTNATYRLEIARKRGRDSFWTLSFVVIDDEPRTYEPLHVSVDFEQPLQLEPDEDYQPGTQANTYVITGVAQGNILMSLFARGNDTFFNFLNTKGQETGARFSLRGLSATLLWIDDQQKRLKSPRTIGVTKTASTGTQTPAPNAYTSGNTTVLAPDKMPPALAKLHFVDGECDAMERPPLSDFGFETARLDEDNRLFLIPCRAAAYNIVYRIYLKSSNTDRPRQLLFADYSNDLGWTGTRDLMNISYDAKTKSLSAYAKARGLGDCGSTSIYRWQQYAFKLVEYRNWEKCDGTRQAQDWPVIYPIPKS